MTTSRGLPYLSARDLSIGWKRGKSAHVLSSGIQIELPPGELVALVGPNGSGKSTLLRTLVGMQAPLAGRIELGGESVSSLSVEERARRTACVFTGRFDAGWFSVFDIVAFGRYPFTDARNRLSENDRMSVATAIESVGMYDMRERRFNELSDGERQKTLIARANAQDCPLLALDEPTAFLDAGARIEVFHLARRLARDEGKAVVLSTHDLDLALRYADTLWLLDRSSSFTSGPPEKLAMEGDIGGAFDGPSLKFDPVTGVFRAAEGERNPLALVRGDEPEASWTERLVERLGFDLVEREGGGLPDATILVRVDEGRSASWTLSAAGGLQSFGRLEELASALRALKKRRGGPPAE
jgi:iron complex transport system ATP-binding protein